jgi:hypothetical protein
MTRTSIVANEWVACHRQIPVIADLCWLRESDRQTVWLLAYLSEFQQVEAKRLDLRKHAEQR